MTTSTVGYSILTLRHTGCMPTITLLTGDARLALAISQAVLEAADMFVALSLCPPDRNAAAMTSR